MFAVVSPCRDTMPHHWKAWETLSHEFGFALTLPELLALAGKPSSAILEIICERQVGRWVGTRLWV